jgi:hypothetical protein
MKIEANGEVGIRITFEGEEEQYGLLAICQIVRQCKKGSSEDYSSYDKDARIMARDILDELNG